MATFAYAYPATHFLSALASLEPGAPPEPGPSPAGAAQSASNRRRYRSAGPTALAASNAASSATAVRSCAPPPPASARSSWQFTSTHASCNASAAARATERFPTPRGPVRAAATEVSLNARAVAGCAAGASAATSAASDAPPPSRQRSDAGPNPRSLDPEPRHPLRRAPRPSSNPENISASRALGAPAATAATIAHFDRSAETSSDGAGARTGESPVTLSDSVSSSSRGSSGSAAVTTKCVATRFVRGSGPVSFSARDAMAATASSGTTDVAAKTSPTASSRSARRKCSAAAASSAASAFSSLGVANEGVVPGTAGFGIRAGAIVIEAQRRSAVFAMRATVTVTAHTVDSVRRSFDASSSRSARPVASTVAAALAAAKCTCSRRLRRSAGGRYRNPGRTWSSSRRSSWSSETPFASSLADSSFESAKPSRDSPGRSHRVAATIVPTRVSPPTRSVMVTRSPCIRLRDRSVSGCAPTSESTSRAAPEGDAVAVSEAHGTTGRGSARVGTLRDPETETRPRGSPDVPVAAAGASSSSRFAVQGAANSPGNPDASGRTTRGARGGYAIRLPGAPRNARAGDFKAPKNGKTIQQRD